MKWKTRIHLRWGAPVGISYENRLIESNDEIIFSLLLK